MPQLSSWLIASLLLVSLVVYLASRAYFKLTAQLAKERRHAEQLSELHFATMEALALAIDAKDQTAHNHIGRVQVYACALARALGMTPDEVQAVKTAALLHDIGKLAVPEHILAKPGPLTPEEFQKIRVHPQVGADIIGAVPFPNPVAPLVLSHHERWDGRGYPNGLKGEEIPVGGRILCLVDYFDALTSDRPYHKPMSVDAAVAMIEQEAGKALDPTAVKAFLRILPEIRAEAEKSDFGQRLVLLGRGESEGAPMLGTPRAAVEPKPSVFDDIAVAHREIYALYEIAQTMGTSLGVADTMAHISSKLSSLVPFSACALFLYNEDDDTVYCRFATGTDSELIQQLALKSGQGLSGWVARNRRPLVNARPSADLEAAGSDLSTALQSGLVCPLIFSDNFIGTLAVYHTTPGFYRDDHRRLLDRVCEQAAAVIHNAVVFEETQEASLTDPLTGLPNTRFMFMHLRRELARAQRLGSEVSLVVMDLNDFKDINDTYGHHVGDRALRDVSQVLRAAIRPYDICVRYAGDEFIVVLAGCGRDEAEHKRLELQHAVEGVVFEAAPDKVIPLSISAGAAVFPQDGDSYESLLAKADSRMYGDKSARKRNAHRQLHAGNDKVPAPPTYGGARAV
jgi:diguanylate cyclase (GGDEF)-like protein/putative nucleotidyltransferase with HDIG domain